MYITKRLGYSFTLTPTTAPDIVHAQGNKASPQGGNFDPYLYDEETPAFVPQADILDAADRPFFQESFADTMSNAKLLLTHEKMNGLATVVNQSVYDNVKTIGSWD